MTAVWAAFCASVIASVGAGILAARSMRIPGTRPRAWISTLDESTLGRIRAAVGVLALAGVAAVSLTRPGALELAFVAAAVAALVGCAVLVVLLEADDGFGDREPDWWPQFERDFREWSRRTPSRV